MGTVELSRPPRLAPLYGRALAGLLARRSGDRVPPQELVLRQVAPDRERVSGYARVCGFRLSGALPPAYPHILAFPLALALLTAPQAPFPVARVVHLANQIEQRRPLDAAEPLDLAVSAEGPREHRLGRCVDVVAVASVSGVEVWRGVSTYLHREGVGEREPRPAVALPEPAALWRVEPATARGYAAVSGDRNPIHTSRVAARVAGFRRRLAHGMWTKARCLAQLSPRLPDAYTVAVRFQAPLLLPATVGFSASPAGPGAWQFAVHGRTTGKPHLTGEVTPGE